MGLLPTANPKKLKIYPVPGPGSYKTDKQNKIPTYVFPKESKKKPQNKDIAPAIGPQSYSPKPPTQWKKPEHHKAEPSLNRLNKGSRSMTQLATTPAPNHYNLRGEFDFKDPQNPDQMGKLPKFAFGQKTAVR